MLYDFHIVVKLHQMWASVVLGSPLCRKILRISSPDTKPSMSVSAVLNIWSNFIFSTGFTTHWMDTWNPIPNSVKNKLLIYNSNHATVQSSIFIHVSAIELKNFQNWHSIWTIPALKTRCVCETQMPPIMANSKDGLGHMDNILIPVGRSCHKKCSCAIWKL